MSKKIKTLIIGLGKIGLNYDYYLKKKSFLTHSSTVENHKNFDLVCGIDIKNKNRKLFEKKYQKKTYINLVTALKTEKIDLVIISYECKNILNILLKILNNNSPKFILFEKPFLTDINQFLKIKKILLKNKINFRVNFQRSFNKRYTGVVKKIFKKNENKKIIISYTGDFLSNAIHYLFLICPFINNIKGIKKNKNLISINAKNLEILFIKLSFDYSMNKMEIYSNNDYYLLSGRNEKFYVSTKSRDKQYNQVKILKNNAIIDLESNFNQKIVMDEINKFINSYQETKKFCKIYQKYLLILNKIIK